VILTAWFLVTNKPMAKYGYSLFVTHVRFVAAFPAYAGVGHLQQ